MQSDQSEPGSADHHSHPKFKMSKIISKYLILQILGYSDYYHDTSKILFESSRTLRSLLSANFFLAEVMLPSLKSIKCEFSKFSPRCTSLYSRERRNRLFKFEINNLDQLALLKELVEKDRSIRIKSILVCY